MRRLCGFFLVAFAALYLLALAVFVVGTFGIFGAETDPLSGVFLIPLGLPWNRMIDGFPESFSPWLAAGAPAINLVVLGLLCRLTHRSDRG
jgi:hypothetical protein